MMIFPTVMTASIPQRVLAQNLHSKFLKLPKRYFKKIGPDSQTSFQKHLKQSRTKDSITIAALEEIEKGLLQDTKYDDHEHDSNCFNGFDEP